MNYLAHLYLSDNDPDSLVGSLMGDFIKGRVGDELEPAIKRGVLLHRKVDVFTDAHPVIRASKRRISPGFRRYAGILVDIFYDHFLASEWPAYSDIPLDAFAQDVYRILEERHATLPAKMQRSMSYMVSNRLLQSYREIEGVRRALSGIETRLRRPSRLGESVHELEQNYAALREDFSAYLPDVVDFVARQGNA
ncbi:MAG: ACP phosphodiesterase [Gammaproteobacteria bacterium]